LDSFVLPDLGISRIPADQVGSPALELHEERLQASAAIKAQELDEWVLMDGVTSTANAT